jgi:hypothetical protein
VVPFYFALLIRLFLFLTLELIPNDTSAKSAHGSANGRSSARRADRRANDRASGCPKTTSG